MNKSRFVFSRGLLAPVLLVVLVVVASALANVFFPGAHALIHGLDAFGDALIVIFVVRLAITLDQSEAALADAVTRAQHAERFAAVADVAAGAAHELATPLGTISLAAEEMRRAIAAGKFASIAEDIALIELETLRCRDILDRMAAGAGTSQGEEPTVFPAQALVDALRELLPPTQRTRLDVHISDAAKLISGPRVASAHAVLPLVGNAFDAMDASGATATNGRALLAIDVVDGEVRVVVRDSGIGMSKDTVARVGEPFFTTKEPGRGMGLGTLLARRFARGLGGNLRFQSEPGKGTTATLRWPARNTTTAKE